MPARRKAAWRLKAAWPVIVCLALVLSSFPAFGQERYPSRPITYIIPFDPGGQSDVEARRQQPLLEEFLGTRVVIQYKPGGGGSVGWIELVQSRPDGYTIAGVNVPHIILQPLLRDDPGFTLDDMEVIALFQATPIGLAVHRDSPFETLQDFIDFARANPGVITVAGSGTHTGHHLASLQFEKLTGARLTYIPFTGAAPQLTAFLGRHVTAILGNSSDLVQHRDGMRVLAFGSEERFPLFPDTPTFKELGIDMTASIDRGVAVPAGTPEDRVALLERAFLRIMEDEAIRRQMTAQGFEPLAMGRQESARYIERLQAEYEALLEAMKE